MLCARIELIMNKRVIYLVSGLILILIGLWLCPYAGYADQQTWIRWGLFLSGIEIIICGFICIGYSQDQ